MSPVGTGWLTQCATLVATTVTVSWSYNDGALVRRTTIPAHAETFPTPTLLDCHLLFAWEHSTAAILGSQTPPPPLIVARPFERHRWNLGNTDLACWTSLPGRSYRQEIPIRLPAAFLQSHAAAVASGCAHLAVPLRYYDADASVIIHLPDETTTGRLAHANTTPPWTTPVVACTPSAPVRRNLQIAEDIADRSPDGRDIRTGTKSLLAVRLVAGGGAEQPVETISEIREAIFFTQSSTSLLLPTVLSQYAAVSHGALRWRPATGPGIHQGVAEITIPDTLRDRTIRGPLMSEILNATAQVVGHLAQVADHIIFCLPDGSILNGANHWTAFTFLYEPYSFYQRSRCTKLSVVMHEIGHALGFRHSGLGSNPYADEQGYMGFTYNRMYEPQKAFNAHKHWISGWFPSRRAWDATNHILPRQQTGTRALQGPIASFVDASHHGLPSFLPVLVKLGRYFLHFNRAKGYNIGTATEFKDMVTINYAEHDDTESDFIAALDFTSPTVVLPFAEEEGGSLILRLCEKIYNHTTGIDYAVISIHWQHPFFPNDRDGNGSIDSTLCRSPIIISDNHSVHVAPLSNEWVIFRERFTSDQEQIHPVPSVNPTNLPSYDPTRIIIPGYDNDDDHDSNIDGVSPTPMTLSPVGDQLTKSPSTNPATTYGNDPLPDTVSPSSFTSHDSDRPNSVPEAVADMPVLEETPLIGSETTTDFMTEIGDRNGGNATQTSSDEMQSDTVVSWDPNSGDMEYKPIPMDMDPARIEQDPSFDVPNRRGSRNGGLIAVVVILLILLPVVVVALAAHVWFRILPRLDEMERRTKAPPSFKDGNAPSEEETVPSPRSIQEGGDG